VRSHPESTLAREDVTVVRVDEEVQPASLVWFAVVESGSFVISGLTEHFEAISGIKKKDQYGIKDWVR
jgi:hypothetical protein